MFSFIKETLKKGLEKLKSELGISNTTERELLKEALERILIENNFGSKLSKLLFEGIEFKNQEDLFSEIKQKIEKIFSSAVDYKKTEKEIILFIGINGSGKTTNLIKLARKLMKEENKVLVIPADTFRAAATEQLSDLCDFYKIDIFKEDAKDPSAIVYAGIEYAKKNNYNKIIIDTSGRMHQNENLLNELKKINKVASSKLDDYTLKKIIVLDSFQGQSLEKQVEQFSSIIKIDGIILTKLDGGCKPGIVVSIVDLLKIPILYLSYGEYKTDLLEFDFKKFANELIGEKN
jgi:fused signal recognition particle receptor